MISIRVLLVFHPLRIFCLISLFAAFALGRGRIATVTHARRVHLREQCDNVSRTRIPRYICFARVRKKYRSTSSRACQIKHVIEESAHIRQGSPFFSINERETMGAGCGDESPKWTPHSGPSPGGRSEMSTPGSAVSTGSLSGRQLVRLNVGGKSFCTSLSTLNKERSMLSVLLSGAFAENSEDEIFIDRDGSRFIHVLNYLRDGKLNVDDYNRAKRESVVQQRRSAALFFFTLPLCFFFLLPVYQFYPERFTVTPQHP